MRNARIGADDQQMGGVLEIGDGMQVHRAEHRFGGGELVGAVLGAGAEGVAHAQRPGELAGRFPAGAVESRGIAEIDADGLGAMGGGQDRQPFRNVLEGFGPRDVLKGPGTSAPAWMVQPIRIFMNFRELKPLVAGKALMHGMLAIRQQPNPPFIHFRQQGAMRLANPAKRVNPAHGPSRPRFKRRIMEGGPLGRKRESAARVRWSFAGAKLRASSVAWLAGPDGNEQVGEEYGHGQQAGAVQTGNERNHVGKLNGVGSIWIRPIDDMFMLSRMKSR